MNAASDDEHSGARSMLRGDIGRRRRALAACALSSLLALVLFEIGIRAALPPTALLDPRTNAYWIAHRREYPEIPPDLVLDPTLGWRMKPHLRIDGVSTNAPGVRGSQEHEPADALRADRIVVLGDSFTFGLGVRDEETYASALERLLGGRELINLGVNGYGLDQELLMWETEGIRYAPANVVLGCFVDDYHRNLLALRELPKPRFVLGRDGELRHLSIACAAAEAGGLSDRHGLRSLDALDFVVRRLASRFYGDRGDAAFAPVAELGERLITELDGSVSAHGARLHVVIIPHPAYDGAPDAARIARSIESVCETLAVPCLDLTPIFESGERVPGAEALYDANGHWSAAGHALAAREIARMLRTDGAAE